MAFPGRRAEDIHEAMNEVGRSARTSAILERLGRRLGTQEGTGPDNDSLLRSLRIQSRAQGLAEGAAKGRAEMVRQMLLSRGIEVSDGFPADAPAFAGASEAAIVATALACDSERDLIARMADIRNR